MAEATTQRSFFWGPHEYSALTFVGKANEGLGNNGLGLTPQFVFNEGLQHYPTPWFDTGAVNTGDIKFAILGFVRETVDPSNLSITNTTTMVHSLYPGDVSRQVVQLGDNIYIATRGTGDGLFPPANESLAPPLWNWTDSWAASRAASMNFPVSPQSYNIMWASTNAADVAEAARNGGGVFDAVSANQNDAAYASALANRERVLGPQEAFPDGVTGRNSDGTFNLTPDFRARLEAERLNLTPGEQARENQTPTGRRFEAGNSIQTTMACIAPNRRRSKRALTGLNGSVPAGAVSNCVHRNNWVVRSHPNRRRVSL